MRGKVGSHNFAFSSADKKVSGFVGLFGQERVQPRYVLMPHAALSSMVAMGLLLSQLQEILMYLLLAFKKRPPVNREFKHRLDIPDLDPAERFQ
jgi:hypothetical protein